MKNITILSVVLASADLLALPIHWYVEITERSPQVFTLQRPRGETYDLEAVLKLHGKPFEPAIRNACIYWQTNGMENLYWSKPASVSNNVLRATWLPSMDPGATTVRGYIGDPGHIYAAAFQFRFISSPGATPNEIPLPQKVIDFAKVTVLNPPWSGGGGGVVDTNAVIDIIHRTVDGSARMLPPYLHYMEMDDTYPDAAEEFYRTAAALSGSCSSVRDGNTLSRNYDWNFDFMPEFVVRVPAGFQTPTTNNQQLTTRRYASLAVCNVGTNLTEADVISGKWSKWYKALPGHAVDGINENGVACNINVVDGDPQTSGWHTTGNLHPLGAIRWILDNATNAQHAATYIASHISFPEGWTQNFHYMICDKDSTYIVENGETSGVIGKAVMTNFRLYPTHSSGEGQERYAALMGGENITSQWWTLTYTQNGYRASDLPGITGESLTQIFDYWENNPRESHRGETFGDQSWWQTVHTSVYDISNRTLRICVQETPDWYVFQVPSSGAKVDAYTKTETDAKFSPIEAQIAALHSGKADKATTYTKTETDENIAAHHDDTKRDITDGNFLFSNIFCTGSGTFDQDVVGNAISENPDRLSEKRNLTDNTCRNTEYTEWIFGGQTYDPSDSYEVREVISSDLLNVDYHLYRNGIKVDSQGFTYPNFQTDLHFVQGDVLDITATRSAVCTDGKKFVTEDVAAKQSDIPALAAPSESATDAQAAKAKSTYDFVNSSINAMAAFYITKNAAGDSFATKAELTAAIASGTFYNGGQLRTPTKNDYLYILADESHPTAAGTNPTTRYSFDGTQWAFQIVVNDTALTAAQLAAMNSGINDALVTWLTTFKGTDSATTLASVRAKLAHLESDGTADDTFATDLFGKQVSIEPNKFVSDPDRQNWNAKADLVDYVLSESESIPANTYRGALTMKSLSSPSDITVGIGARAFANLPKLRTVDLGSVSTIDSTAFKGCTLDRLVIRDSTSPTTGITTFGAKFSAGSSFEVLYDCVLAQSIFNNMSGAFPETVYLPLMSNMNSAFAFQSNRGIRNVIAPSLERINDYLYTFVGTRNAYNLCFGLVAYIGSVNFEVATGSENESDSQNNKCRILVKNTIESFIAAENGSSRYGIVHGTVYCRDGYIRSRNAGGTGVGVAYSSVSDLPIDGFDYYTYEVAGVLYRWDDNIKSYVVVVEEEQ